MGKCRAELPDIRHELLTSGNRLRGKNDCRVVIFLAGFDCRDVHRFTALLVPGAQDVPTSNSIL